MLVLGILVATATESSKSNTTKRRLQVHTLSRLKNHECLIAKSIVRGLFPLNQQAQPRPWRAPPFRISLDRTSPWYRAAESIGYLIVHVEIGWIAPVSERSSRGQRQVSSELVSLAVRARESPLGLSNLFGEAQVCCLRGA